MSEDKLDFLNKLAAEVTNESKPGESKSEGSKSDVGKKDGKKSDKKFPFPPKGKDEKSNKQNNNDNNEQGSKGQNGKSDEGEEQAKMGINENGGEQEIPGNESAEQGHVEGNAAIDPKAIFDFFAQNPAPNDEAFHEFAESNGYDVHAAESAAYALAGKYIQFLRGGKSQGMDPNSVDPQQLEMGIQVESEHTDDPTTCKKIALDHLAENPQYYTHLQQMESGGGNQEKPAVEPKKEQVGVKSTPAKGQQTDVRSEGSIKS